MMKSTFVSAATNTGQPPRRSRGRKSATARFLSRIFLSGIGASLLGVTHPAQAAQYTYTTTNTTSDLWSAGTNWSAVPISAATTQLTFNAANATVLPDGLVNTSTDDIAGAFSLNILDLNGTGPSTGAGVININAASGSSLNFVSNGATLPKVNLNALKGTAGLTYNLNAPMTLTNNTTFGGAGTANFNITGLISGAGTLTKTGTSSLTLNNGNTFTGAASVSGSNTGTGAVEQLIFTSIADSGTVSSLGAGTSVGIANAKLVFAGTTSQNSNRSFTASNTAYLTNFGTGTLSLTGNFVLSGTASLILGGANTGTNTVSGNISGSGTEGLTKADAGYWKVTGTNTYLGTTSINGGTLEVTSIGNVGGAGSGLGAQTTAANGTLAFLTGTLLYTGAGETSNRNIKIGNGAAQTGTINSSGAGAVTFTGNVTTAGFAVNDGLVLRGTNTGQNTLSGVLSDAAANSKLSITKSDSGAWALTGANTYTGSTTVNGGVLSVANGSLPGNVANTATVNFLGSGTYGSVISGTNGKVTKTDAGTFALTGANTYTGGTTFGAGTLNAGSANALGTTGSLAFTGGTLQYSAANTADYSARIKNSTGAVSVDTNGQNVTYAGVLDSTNSGGFTKSGAGTVTFSGAGANTYAGTTTVSAGTLALNKTAGVNAVPSDLVVNNGGTVSLLASNQIGNSANVTLAGGTLALNGKSEGTTSGSSPTGQVGVTATAAGAGQLSVTTGSGISYLDFGLNNTGAVFTFESYDFSNLGDLYVLNYNDGNFTGTYTPATGGGPDQLFFGNGQYNDQQLTHVFFVDPQGAGGATQTGLWQAHLLSTGEVVAPEPSQWAALLVGALGLGGLALKARRRGPAAV